MVLVVRWCLVARKGSGGVDFKSIPEPVHK